MNFFRSQTSAAPPAEAFQLPPQDDQFQDEDPDAESQPLPTYSLTSDEQVLIQTILDEEDSYEDSPSPDLLGMQDPEVLRQDGATSSHNLESSSQFSLHDPKIYQSTVSSSRYSFVSSLDDFNAPLVVERENSHPDQELVPDSTAGPETGYDSHRYLYPSKGPATGLEPFFLDEYSNSDRDVGDGIFIHSTNQRFPRWTPRRLLRIALLLLGLILILSLSIGLTNRDRNTKRLVPSTTSSPTETPTRAPTTAPTSPPTIPPRIPLQEGDMDVPILRDGYVNIVSSQDFRLSNSQVDNSLILTVSETIPWYFESNPAYEGAISFLELDWQAAYQRQDFDLDWIHQVKLRLTLSNRLALMHSGEQHNKTSITLYAKAYTVPTSLDENDTMIMDVNEYLSNKIGFLDNPDWIPFQVQPFDSTVAEIPSTELVQTLYTHQEVPSTWDTLRIVLVHDNTNVSEDPAVKFWSSIALEERLHPRFIVNLQEPRTATPSISPQPSRSPMPSFMPSTSTSPTRTTAPSLSQSTRTYGSSLSFLPTNEDGFLPYCNFCGDMLPNFSNHTITGTWPEEVLDILGMTESEDFLQGSTTTPLQCGTVRQWILSKAFSLTPRQCTQLHRLVSEKCCHPHPVCNMCLSGLQVSGFSLDQVIVVPTSETMEITTIWTCQQYQQESEEGKIPTGVCSALRQATSDTCCGLPL